MFSFTRVHHRRAPPNAWHVRPYSGAVNPFDWHDPRNFVSYMIFSGEADDDSGDDRDASEPPGPGCAGCGCGCLLTICGLLLLLLVMLAVIR